MRTQIKVDSATPTEVFNLTRAFQLAARDGEPTVLTSEPTVTVTGSAMSWASPPMSRERAAAMLREFDRLEAGLFDVGTVDRDPNTTQPGTLVFPKDFGKVPVIPTKAWGHPDNAPRHIRQFSDGVKVVQKDDPNGEIYTVENGDVDSRGAILVSVPRGGFTSRLPIEQDALEMVETGQFDAEGSAYVEGEDPIGGDTYTSEPDWDGRIKVGSTVKYRGGEYVVKGIIGTDASLSVPGTDHPLCTSLFALTYVSGPDENLPESKR